MHNRVAITGLGCVTPLGSDVDVVWSNLIAGQSGIHSIDLDKPEQYRSRIGGQVKGFSSDLIPKGFDKKYEKFIHYGFYAAQQAVESSGINGQYDPYRVACIVGSGIGGLNSHIKSVSTYIEKGVRRISPYYIPGTIINTLPGLIASEHQIKGPTFSAVSACATGSHNIIVGSQLIQSGVVDAVVCGASENFCTVLGLGGFGALRALSTRNDDPAKASRPWDLNRDGFVLSEGAGILVLENEKTAKSRGQKILSYISGHGASSDAYQVTLPQPDGEGVIHSMNQALKGINLSEVGYINAHATSTPAGDIVELRAVESVFKGHLDKLSMSSTKSSIGHPLGAAGSIEAIFCVQALLHQIAPPTLNITDPEVEPGIDLVPLESKKINTQFALSNSFGFGGQNASILFESA